MSAQKFTPWQAMKAYETQVRKIEDNWRILLRKDINKKEQDAEDGVIMAEADCCKPHLTYYNNGKCNACCKTEYDYNFGYCEGYDQSTKRCDRKHAIHYMHIDLEEEYPCRAVPILTNTHYGFRPPIDTMQPIAKKKLMSTFFRNHGTPYCFDANGYSAVKLNPTWSFRYNQSYGYTYSPPVN